LKDKDGNVTNKGVALRKGVGIVNSSGNRVFVSDVVIYRYAEVLLMLAEIEESDVEGVTWLEKILHASNLDDSMPAFSEFETYGTYCSVNYPGLYKPRHLNTFREAGYICGRKISEDKLRVMSFDLDTASFEMRHAPMFPYNLPQFIFNNRKRFKKMKSMTFRQIIKKVWTKWLGKQSIDKQLWNISIDFPNNVISL
jgi:hypothetical protein